MIARPPAGSPRPYRFPDVTRHTLANGLGVWLVPLPERELVSVHFLTDAGAATEDDAQAGVAALTAQLLVTGTRDLDSAAFAETTERLGIEVGSESSWDSARAGFLALREHLDTGMGLLADMLRAPRFDPSEFERLKAERLADILQARAEPGRLADERFLGEVFADGVPYGRLSAGTPESVGALTIEEVGAHHATRYAPNVADIILAGAFDPDVALAAVDRHFGSWTGTGPGHRTISPTERGGRRIVLVDRPGSVQSELRVGHLGIDRADPRYFPAMVMAALLGGVFGSRLNHRLREELGYTYGARCSFDPRRAVGPFSATAAVQTEVTVDAIRELLGQLDRIREAPPEEAELAEVRDFLVGVFPLRFESTAGIAAAIEPLAIYDLPDDWWHTYRSKLEAVTPDDVHTVARELIRPDEALILLVGDAAKLRDDLAAAGLGELEVRTES
ncbi:MAG TPA: pitrilysin family protein [Candidatus Limnocylindria bacterium]